MAAVGIVCLGYAMFPVRRYLGWIRLGVVLMLVALHFAMKKPVWHLIARIDIVGGSTGWHRYNLINKAVEKERLIATLQDEMNHPKLATTGLGNVDPARFAKSIDLVVKANSLPRTPAPDEIFSDAFLPAEEDRIYKLL